MRCLWGGRSQPSRTTGCGGRACLPLGERAQVLRKAVGLAERHLAAGTAAEPLTPAPGGPRVRGAFGPLVLRGAPRGDVAAYAPGNALPGLVGPAPAGARPHAAAAGRPFSYGLLPTPPRAPPPPPHSRTLGGPHGRRPEASRS